MKLYELMGVMSDDINIIVQNEGGDEYGRYDGRESIDERYNDCDVLKIMIGSRVGQSMVSPVLIVRLDIYKEVEVTFTTEIDGTMFEHVETYNKFNFDCDDDLIYEIDEAMNEWLDDLKSDIENYADKEVEGM